MTVTNEMLMEKLIALETMMTVIVHALIEEDEPETVTSLDGTVTSRARDQGQSLG